MSVKQKQTRNLFAVTAMPEIITVFVFVSCPYTYHTAVRTLDWPRAWEQLVIIPVRPNHRFYAFLRDKTSF